MSEFFPSHWWGMSQKLRCIIRAEIYYGADIGLALEKVVQREENLRYSRWITIKWKDHDVQVGRYGRLHKEVADVVRKTWHDQEQLPWWEV